VTRTAEEAQKNRQDDRDAVLTFLLRHPDGRAHVWAMLEQCGVFRTSFSGEQPMMMAFHEGRRDIGLGLLNAVREFDANTLTVMKAEDKQRQERYHVIAPERDEFDE
jgi:hypothetical protein